MDGLTRREIEVPLESITWKGNGEDHISAYIVGGRDVMKSWEKTSSLIVLCPDINGWKDKNNRIIADELAFSNQAVVIIPDLYDQNSFGILIC